MLKAKNQAASYTWTGISWWGSNRFKFQDFRKVTDSSRGISEIFLKFINFFGKMATCNWHILETIGSFKGPGLNHICVRLCPALSHLLHNLVFLLTPVWELFAVGNNVTIPDRLSHETPLTCEETSSNKLEHNESNVNLNICNFDQVLSHWFQTRKSSHTGAGRKAGQWRRHGRGGTQLNIDVI